MDSTNKESRQSRLTCLTQPRHHENPIEVLTDKEIRRCDAQFLEGYCTDSTAAKCIVRRFRHVCRMSQSAEEASALLEHFTRLTAFASNKFLLLALQAQEKKWLKTLYKLSDAFASDPAMQRVIEDNHPKWVCLHKANQENKCHNSTCYLPSIMLMLSSLKPGQKSHQTHVKPSANQDLRTSDVPPTAAAEQPCYPLGEDEHGKDGSVSKRLIKHVNQQRKQAIATAKLEDNSKDTSSAKEPLPDNRLDWIGSAQLPGIEQRLQAVLLLEEGLHQEKRLLYKRKMRLAPATVRYLSMSCHCTHKFAWTLGDTYCGHGYNKKNVRGHKLQIGRMKCGHCTHTMPISLRPQKGDWCPMNWWCPNPDCHRDLHHGVCSPSGCDIVVLH